MRDLGVTESYKLKKQVVVSASEAAEMILRVDDILKSAPRRREGHWGNKERRLINYVKEESNQDF